MPFDRGLSRTTETSTPTKLLGLALVSSLLLVVGPLPEGHAAPLPAALQTDGKLVSTTTTGPPLEIRSPSFVAGLNADLLDGSDASDYRPPPQNVILVGESGTPFTSIQLAIDSIVDASASNRYLIQVGPGIYSEQVTMKRFVDIEGAGQDLTKITASGFAGLFTGTVIVVLDTELRSLTVENTGGGMDYAVALFCPSNADGSRVLQVTAVAEGGTQSSIGVNNNGDCVLDHVIARAVGGLSALGIWNTGGSIPRLRHVTVHAEGGSSSNDGINNGNGGSAGFPVLLVDVTATASGAGATALFNTSSGTIAVHHSNLSATTAIDVQSGGSVAVANSLVAGGIAGSSPTCVGAYNALFQALGSGCT